MLLAPRGGNEKRERSREELPDVARRVIEIKMSNDEWRGKAGPYHDMHMKSYEYVIPLDEIVSWFSSRRMPSQITASRLESLIEDCHK